MTKRAIAATAFGAAILSLGLASAATAAPEAAGPDATGVSATTCDAGPHYVANNKAEILGLLQRKGINANFVDQSGGCVEAFVTNSSGKQSIELFAPYTLWPVKSI